MLRNSDCGLEAQQNAQAVFNLGQSFWGNNSGQPKQPFFGDRPHILTLDKALFLQACLGRAHGDVKRDTLGFGGDGQDNNQPAGTVIKQIYRYNQTGPFSSLLVAPTGIKINEPYFAATWLRHNGFSLVHR